MKRPTKKHPEFVVLVDVEAGFVNKTDVVRCSNFNTAVSMYRKMCDMYGSSSCQILMEVVGYGEKV